MPETRAKPSPGLELDALVAEKVMGWKVHPRNTAHWMLVTDDECDYRPAAWVGDWCPSRSIADAWDVVEKFTPVGIAVHCCRREDLGADGKWRCFITTPERDFDILTVADTAPHAICLAALDACEMGAR